MKNRWRYIRVSTGAARVDSSTSARRAVSMTKQSKQKTGNNFTKINMRESRAREIWNEERVEKRRISSSPNHQVQKEGMKGAYRTSKMGTENPQNEIKGQNHYSS